MHQKAVFSKYIKSNKRSCYPDKRKCIRTETAYEQTQILNPNCARKAIIIHVLFRRKIKMSREIKLEISPRQSCDFNAPASLNKEAEAYCGGLVLC